MISSWLVNVIFMMTLAFPAPALDGTPDTGTPVAAECPFAPRSADELAALLEEAAPVTSDVMADFSVSLPALSQVMTAVDDATRAEVLTAATTLADCFREDAWRGLGGVSDGFIERLVQADKQRGMNRAWFMIEESAAATRDGVTIDPANDQIGQLANGNVVVIRTILFPMAEAAVKASGGQTHSGQVEVFVFARSGDHWLLDDLRLGVDKRGGGFAP